MSEKNVSHIEDKDLLERYYSDHNNEWLEILFPRYTMLLLGVCMKYLKNEENAKDAVQQIFLKVIHEIGKYKVEYFKSWIYMIAKNHCLMQFRNTNLKIVEITSETESFQDIDERIRLIDKEKKLNLLEEGLKELNREQLDCITLFYLEKKSYSDISAITGYSLLQIKSFIQNGKRNLKQYLLRNLNIDKDLNTFNTQK